MVHVITGQRQAERLLRRRSAIAYSVAALTCWIPFIALLGRPLGSAGQFPLALAIGGASFALSAGAVGWMVGCWYAINRNSANLWIEATIAPVAVVAAALFASGTAFGIADGVLEWARGDYFSPPWSRPLSLRDVAGGLAMTLFWFPMLWWPMMVICFAAASCWLMRRSAHSVSGLPNAL